MGIIVGEAESCTGGFIFIVRLNRIPESSGLPHDRHRSVSQAHKLAQAAWLEQGRHKEGVTGAVNPVSYTHLSATISHLRPHGVPPDNLLR